MKIHHKKDPACRAEGWIRHNPYIRLRGNMISPEAVAMKAETADQADRKALVLAADTKHDYRIIVT